MKNKVDDKSRLIIGILVLIIFVLIGVLIYSFFIKPSLIGYIFSKQQESYNKGIEDTVKFIIVQIQQQGYTEIFWQNQTMVLVPYQGPVE